MNLFRPYAGSLLVAMLAASASLHADVELSPEQRENLGIRTEPVRAVQIARSWSASAQVLDASTLVVSLGELHAAEVAAVASRAEAERSARLYSDDKNVARKAVDAARLQEIADEGRVKTARAQLLTNWGSGVSGMPSIARDRLVDELIDGRTVLVRADQLLPLPDDASVRHATVIALDGRRTWSADRLGTIPQAANPTLGGASLLRVQAVLPMGQLLRANLLDDRTASAGVSVAPGAIVRWRGSEWVYEETLKNHFQRREIRSRSRVDGRTAVESSGSTLKNVVSVGARALLGAELGAAQPEDSAGTGD